MAAAPEMTSIHRSAVWGFIALLAALAFLRSLAPERTEKAMHHLLAARDSSSVISDQRHKQLSDLKEELQRERAALERWKERLDREQKQLNSLNQSMGAHEESPKNADDVGLNLHEEDPDAFSDAVTDTQAEEADGETGEMSDEIQSDISQDNVTQEVEGSFPKEAVPALGDEECPNIVIPEFARAGLGTQVKHITSALSLTLALRNSCMVIPPVVADDGMENFRPVPFHEVFDVDKLAETGLRFVPLRTCQKHGVSTVFDDSGAESAIVKNFAGFVQEGHPTLAKESTLVHGDSKGYRFQPGSEVKGDVTVVAKYVRSQLPDEPGRHCVGIGRMRSDIEVNPDVLRYLRSSPSVDDFVTEKFQDANETLFIKLRWNKAHCDKVRTEDGTVCIFSNNIASLEEYVHAIAYAANEVGATKIYMSFPAHIPTDVSSYFAANLTMLDPVLLDVDGDVFTANVIERELAIRARLFVSDGGAWDESVMVFKRMLFPDFFAEDFNSLTIITSWKDAGMPKDSPLLKTPTEPDVPGAMNNNAQDYAAVPMTVSNVGDNPSSALQEQPMTPGKRPDVYVPPASFDPNDEDEQKEMLQVLTQGREAEHLEAGESMNAAVQEVVEDQLTSNDLEPQHSKSGPSETKQEAEKRNQLRAAEEQEYTAEVANGP